MVENAIQMEMAIEVLIFLSSLVSGIFEIKLNYLYYRFILTNVLLPITEPVRSIQGRKGVFL